MDSHNYGDQLVLQSVLCKLETPETCWDNSVWVWRPENQRTDDVNPSPRPEEDEIRCFSSAVRQEKKEEISPFFAFCLIQALQGLHDSEAHWRERWTPESTHSNANLTKKSLQKHTQKQCLIWGSHIPLKLIHKVNHHKVQPETSTLWRHGPVR